jgi:hypothetical protein
MEQEEEAQQKALKKEQTRIESGAVYRRLEQEHAHQNNNKHTAASYFTCDCNDSFHPKNLADALRMGSRNVATTNFLPLLRDELAQQGLEESVLTTTWGQRVSTFF